MSGSGNIVFTFAKLTLFQTDTVIRIVISYDDITYELAATFLQPAYSVAVFFLRRRVYTVGRQEAGTLSQVGKRVHRRLLDRVSRKLRRGFQILGHRQ